MNYEQKYNKLVNAIKVLQETNPSDEGIQNWVKDNVPEFKESEGENIRKAIISGMTALKKQGRETFAAIHINDCIAWLEKQGQKPAWSEEDKRCLTNAIYACKQMSDEDYDGSQSYIDAINWLKSLKDRVQPKQEWNKKDERVCQETIDWFEKKCFPYALEHENPARESIKWLKYLKERMGG